MSARAPRRARATFRGLCVYCGLPTPAPPACRGHSDLLAIDPHYSERAVLELAEELVSELDYTRPYPVVSEVLA